MKTESDYIPWSGGECPTDNPVSILYRNGNMDFTKFPHFMRWNHIGNEFDIVGYKIEINPNK